MQPLSSSPPAANGGGSPPPPGEPPRAGRSVTREYLEALIIAVIFATFARAFVLQAFKIPTASMEENLIVGDHVLVNKFIYGSTSGAVERALLPVRPIARGDVVVFKYPADPGRDFIKRCVGLPGDTVELVDKTLRINGRVLEESGYVHHEDPNTYPRTPLLAESYRKRDNFGPYRVPDEHYFCLGDNRDNSHDSRFWGPVPAAYVKGRAFLIYWSFRSERETTEWPGYAGRLRQLAEVVRGFSSQTRWERTFSIVR